MMNATISAALREMGAICLAGETEGLMLELPFSPHLIGRPGFLHGGAIGGLLVLACDAALDGRGRAFSTGIQFLRGAREQALWTRAVVVGGGRIVTVNATAWQDAGKPIASTSRKYWFSDIEIAAHGAA